MVKMKLKALITETVDTSEYYVLTDAAMQRLRTDYPNEIIGSNYGYLVEKITAFRGTKHYFLLSIPNKGIGRNGYVVVSQNEIKEVKKSSV